MRTENRPTPARAYALGWIIGITFANATHLGAPWWLIAVIVILAFLGLLNAMATTHPRTPRPPAQD